MTAPTAILADDEPLLLDALQTALSEAWPELSIVATAQNGIEAVAAISKHKPDIAFLDIQMPGATGLEVAQTITEDWSGLARSGVVTSGLARSDLTDAPPPPLWVFVTAFDQYAVDAFEKAAVDYVLKPVKPERLGNTVERLRRQLTSQQAPSNSDLNRQLRQVINEELKRQQSSVGNRTLQTVNASIGNQIKIIPIQDVILFVSADKYVTVVTEDGEALIREPLKKLLPQLDPAHFTQVHRSTIVNLNKIVSAVRDDNGHMTLTLNGSDRQPAVSRLYQSLFQAM